MIPQYYRFARIVSQFPVGRRYLGYYEFDKEPAELQQITPHRFSHRVSRNWSVKDYPNGGYLCTLGRMVMVDNLVTDFSDQCLSSCCTIQTYFIFISSLFQQST